MCQEIIKGKRCKRSKEPYCYAHVKTINSDCKKSNADSNMSDALEFFLNIFYISKRVGTKPASTS